MKKFVLVKTAILQLVSCIPKSNSILNNWPCSPHFLFYPIPNNNHLIINIIDSLFSIITYLNLHNLQQSLPVIQSFYWIICLLSNYYMATKKTDLEIVQQQLKNQFAKTYRMRQTKSLLEVNQKDKLPARNVSVVDSQIARSGRNRQQMWKSQIIQQNQQLSDTLRQLNFLHHDPETCLCGSCNCGRHLCRLDIIKPNLKKQSTYQKSYQPKHSSKHEPVLTKHTQPLKGSYLDIGTEYNKKFASRLQAILERPHPKDTLKFQGPAQQLTTYGSLFPGHRGKNQYIKPSNKHKRGDYPLMAKSTYSTQFVIKSKVWDFDCKQPDHLKTGSNWYGSTTYNAAFKGYNPEQDVNVTHPHKLEKYERTPNFGKQFETNYNKEFVKKKSQICPSKIMLESGLGQQFSKSKSLFQQNTDFKSMSPQFKPISTSKHFYV